jgi:hypothetical protein
LLHAAGLASDGTGDDVAEGQAGVVRSTPEGSRGAVGDGQRGEGDVGGEFSCKICRVLAARLEEDVNAGANGVAGHGIRTLYRRISKAGEHSEAPSGGDGAGTGGLCAESGEEPGCGHRDPSVHWGAGEGDEDGLGVSGKRSAEGSRQGKEEEQGVEVERDFGGGEAADGRGRELSERGPNDGEKGGGVDDTDGYGAVGGGEGQRREGAQFR